MPDYHRKRRPPIEPYTGRPVDRRQIGCFRPFPQLSQSQQAGAFSALARVYRGAKTQIGEDGYPEMVRAETKAVTEIKAEV